MAMDYSLKLDDYQISSSHGFLPSEPPSAKLPNYYEAWELLCSNLYALRVGKQLVDKVARVPLLTTAHLADESEWRSAYVLLGFIANAYIWGSEKPIGVRADLSRHEYC